MKFTTQLKAKATQFFFDRIVLAQETYPIDAAAAFDDEERTVPTPAGQVRTLFHRPVGKPRHGLPVVVMIHGGGFLFGRPEHEAVFCRRMAQNLGCLVVNPDYDRTPDHAFPTAARQCYELVAWLAREAESLGIDKERIAVGGNSAGGNLAIGVVNQALAKGFPHICFQILDCPFLDAVGDPREKKSPIAKPLLSPGLMALVNECYIPAGTDLRDPLLSPLFASLESLSGHPPTLLITAEYDVLREEGKAYAARLREAGVEVRHEGFTGVDHVFSHLGPKEPADAVWNLMDHCLKEAFARAPAAKPVGAA